MNFPLCHLKTTAFEYSRSKAAFALSSTNFRLRFQIILQVSVDRQESVSTESPKNRNIFFQEYNGSMIWCELYGNALAVAHFLFGSHIVGGCREMGRTGHSFQI